MKVKKFYGVDNYDVISKVKDELGSNAVILHQRKIKPKGLLGFLKKSIVEVVAAIEENEIATTVINTANVAKTQELDLKQRIALKSNENELTREINDIKAMLGTVVNQMQNINLSKTGHNLEDRKGSCIYNILRENEMDEELINELLDKCDLNVNSVEMNDKETIKNILTQIIPPTINNDIDPKSKVVFFIGPTGVGKTTTIAKIAASYSLEKGLSVGLISADTYRIAAVEQLRIYSEILNIPLEVIYSPNEIHDALDRLRSKDIIMIDTAGRSHKNNEHVEELSVLLDEIKNQCVYLVISSTTKNSDIEDILATYSFIHDYKIIFTKLDEVSTYGPILNIAMREPECISYVTTGQSVPDDIEVLTSDKILDMLLKEI